ncbi:uncharacterized protein LOC132088572 [Daphnia carinata]|uniref:uncharacterized protein LOC132088572 n=1 Tax=Daphnia carinata TaxID=120202 RepID=UPI0028692D0D|nr:uncharacterized protein LOC132088572 [Daphnia carinata]
MQHSLQSFLVLAVAVYCASAQYQASDPHPSFDAIQVKAEERFIKTASLTFVTTTVTVTTSAVTTCTTSTGGLSVCTASGRRRRGLHLSGNREGRGLFYNENEGESEDGSIFLPLPETIKEKSTSSEVVPVRQVRKEAAPIPFVVQPGFNAPAGQGRVLLYFGTSTVTTTSTTTTTTTLTATCRSTTGYQLCGSTGK